MNSIPCHNVNCQKYPSFRAIPLAEYNYLQKASEKVTIYKLEKSDTSYLQHLAKNLKKFFIKYEIDNESAKQVIGEAFNAGVEILKGEVFPEEKADILMAFYKDKPCSILIGNALKIDKEGKLHYSSRKNQAKNETELDWLAAWNKQIHGKAQVTVYEFFCQLLKSGFKHCFVRSEIPEKSPAESFYLKMGFERLSDKKRALLRKNDYPYVIGKYDDETDKIIPMKATLMDIVNTHQKKADVVLRKELKSAYSVSLPEEQL